MFPTMFPTMSRTTCSHPCFGTGVGPRCLEHMFAPRNRDTRRPLSTMFQHETHMLSTGYQQVINKKNNNLKLGADFKILHFNSAPMVFEKFLGPPFLKRVPCDPLGVFTEVRHQAVKKKNWGVGGGFILKK